MYDLYIGSTNKIKLVDGHRFFANFINCKSIDGLENIDLSNAISMSEMFYNCRSLKTIDLSTFDTSKIEDMQGLFSNCYSLEYINLSTFNTSNVVSMGWMFSSCISLESLDLSNFDTRKVKYIMNMFRDCNRLVNLSINSFDTSNITDMENVFYGCSSIENLNLNNFDTSQVTSMDSMFYNCTKLNTLRLENFDTQNVKSMKFMFYGCNNLKYIFIDKFDVSNLQYVGGMLYGCDNLNNFNFDEYDKTNLVDYSYIHSNEEKIYKFDVYTSNIILNDEYSYYKIPNLSSMSGDCVRLNNYFNGLVDNVENEGYNKIDYKFYICDNVLSLIVYYVSDYGDAANKYEVYNINATTGKLISNSELLNLKNVTAEEILGKASMFYTEEFISCWKDKLSQNDMDKLRRGEDIANENANTAYKVTINAIPNDINKLAIYIDNMGEINIAAYPIQGYAGATI